MHEFEIKTSKADFKNEAKNKKMKHMLLESGGSREVPNYFSFVVPEGLITVDDIAPKYGLIYIKGKKIEMVKRPKLLHKRKCLTEKMMKSLTRSLSFKIFNRFSDNLSDMTELMEDDTE